MDLVEKYLKENDEIDAKDILKKMKIKYVTKEPKWKEGSDQIVFNFSRVLSGDIMFGIENYTKPTSWKDFTDFSKFFKTEDEFMKKAKNALKRYQKQGYIFFVHNSSMLKNVIFAFRKKKEQ